MPTIAEKVLSLKSGQRVGVGEIVEAEVDYVMLNDVTAPLAIKALEELEAKPIAPKVVLIPDHFVPNKDVASAEQAKLLREFARKYRVENYFELGRGGICHQVMVEEGFVAPGRLIVGADSHSCTYGALNAFGVGIGSVEAAVAMATGKLWFKVPESIEVRIEGEPGRWIGGKDIALKLLAELGARRAIYKALEILDNTKSLTLADRLTIANMGVEAGAKTAIFHADERVFSYLESRLRGSYKPVHPDEDASYEMSLTIDASEIEEPLVAVPPSPANVVPVSEVEGVEIDQAYLGSCTNGRIEDLRIAAELLKGKKVSEGVRFIVTPASMRVYQQAVEEGLIETFVRAGAYVCGPSCGACLGAHSGVLAAGEVCISSTNRNFVGRMGHRDSKVYLTSPAVVAASAVEGRIAAPS